MALNVGSDGGEDDPMMEINTTPLIDVMLVLLVMLIITIPLQTHAVKLDMPQAISQEMQPDESSVVQLVVAPDGTVLWNNEEVADSAALEERFLSSVNAPVESEIHLRPDRNVEYDYVARVLAVAQRTGVTKIGFTGNEQYDE